MSSCAVTLCAPMEAVAAEKRKNAHDTGINAYFKIVFSMKVLYTGLKPWASEKRSLACLDLPFFRDNGPELPVELRGVIWLLKEACEAVVLVIRDYRGIRIAA